MRLLKFTPVQGILISAISDVDAYFLERRKDRWAWELCETHVTGAEIPLAEGEADEARLAQEQASRHHQRRTTAFHEAGHFVIGRVLKLDEPHVVTIQPSGDAAGHVGGDYPIEEGMTNDRIADVVITCYAGRAAHLKLAPEETVIAYECASEDIENARRFIGLMGLRGEAAKTREHELRDRAAAVVDEHWVAIKEIAEALELYETIDGEEATAIYEASIGARAVEELHAIQRIRGRQELFTPWRREYE